MVSKQLMRNVCPYAFYKLPKATRKGNALNALHTMFVEIGIVQPVGRYINLCKHKKPTNVDNPLVEGA